MQCSACGHANLFHAKFCAHCGDALSLSRRLTVVCVFVSTAVIAVAICIMVMPKSRESSQEKSSGNSFEQVPKNRQDYESDEGTGHLHIEEQQKRAAEEAAEAAEDAIREASEIGDLDTVMLVIREYPDRAEYDQYFEQAIQAIEDGERGNILRKAMKAARDRNMKVVLELMADGRDEVIDHIHRIALRNTRHLYSEMPYISESRHRMEHQRVRAKGILSQDLAVDSEHEGWARGRLKPIGRGIDLRLNFAPAFGDLERLSQEGLNQGHLIEVFGILQNEGSLFSVWAIKVEAWRRLD